VLTPLLALQALRSASSTACLTRWARRPVSSRRAVAGTPIDDHFRVSALVTDLSSSVRVSLVDVFGGDDAQRMTPERPSLTVLNEPLSCYKLEDDDASMEMNALDSTATSMSWPPRGGDLGTKAGAQGVGNANRGVAYDPGSFRRDIWPRLARVPLKDIIEAIGCSMATASNIRRGKRTPHVST
jgi:hypothetical protein